MKSSAFDKNKEKNKFVRRLSRYRLLPMNANGENRRSAADAKPEISGIHCDVDFSTFILFFL
jgi:hypothetical protein